MAAERSHILVLGTRGSGGDGNGNGYSCCPEQFVRRLLSLDAPESPQDGPPFHWTLTTKYYRAELALHVRHAEPSSLLAVPLEEEEEEGGGPHGVIVVVDGQRAAGALEAWRPWYVTLQLLSSNSNLRIELPDGTAHT